ncbi:hypothetical protein Tco_0154897 [Tanacetum coccineum]
MDTKDLTNDKYLKKVREEYLEKEKMYAKVVFDEYMAIKREIDMYKRDQDLEYDPSNKVFTEWLALMFYNHLDMDWYTKNALWVYWMRGDNEVILTEDEGSIRENMDTDDKPELDEIFGIDTDLFDYETPLWTKFNEFNHLLKIDPDLLTNDIAGERSFLKNTKNYWLYDHDWYDNLVDGELKTEALRQKVVYEKSWGNATIGVKRFCAWLKRDNNLRPKDRSSGPHKNADNYHHAAPHNVDIGDKNVSSINQNNEMPPQCTIRRFEIIKYSFRSEEQFMGIKEQEYENDDGRSKNDACYAYQDIFRKMDEGWYVTRVE